LPTSLSCIRSVGQRRPAEETGCGGPVRRPGTRDAVVTTGCSVGPVTTVRVTLPCTTFTCHCVLIQAPEPFTLGVAVVSETSHFAPPAHRARCLAGWRAYIPTRRAVFHSPLEPASGGNDNSSGGALPRLPACPSSRGITTVVGVPSPSQQNVAHACLFATPVTTAGRQGAAQPAPHAAPIRVPLHCPSCGCPLFLSSDCFRTWTVGDEWPPVRGARGITGAGALPCRLRATRQLWLSGDLPLGSRPADPPSTTVGVEACSTPVLNHTQQGLFPLFTRWSTRYCNQDLRRKALQLGVAPTGTAVSHVLSTQRCSAQLPHRRRTVRQIQLH